MRRLSRGRYKQEEQSEKVNTSGGTPTRGQNGRTPFLAESIRTKSGGYRLVWNGLVRQDSLTPVTLTVGQQLILIMLPRRVSRMHRLAVYV